MANVVSYQPWRVGETYPYWVIPITTDQGPENLTGITISNFSLYFRTATGTEVKGTGTFSLVTAYPGILQYKQSIADVAGAFNGSIVIRALYPPSNTTADQPVWDPIPFSIVP